MTQHNTARYHELERQTLAIGRKMGLIELLPRWNDDLRSEYNDLARTYGKLSLERDRVAAKVLLRQLLGKATASGSDAS